MEKIGLLQNRFINLKNFVKAFLIIFLLILSGCSEKIILTNSIYHKKVFITKNIPDKIKYKNTKSIIPFSGTVSHHLLISTIIDRWFADLKNKRNNIKTFFIISPDHFRNGGNRINLTSSSFLTCFGKVKTNKNYVNQIEKRLSLKDDDFAFKYEHGINDIVPFIKKYFHDSNIVPITTDQIYKNNSTTIKLAAIISEIMKKDKNCFLLISTDFSHRENLVNTEKNDKRSIDALSSFDINSLNEIYSDNMVGLYIMLSVGKNLNKQNIDFNCNTNSYYYSREEKENITSYIFSLIY